MIQRTLVALGALLLASVAHSQITPTPSPTATISPSPSITPTPSVTPTPSGTPTPSATPTPSVTPTPSATPIPTVTPTVTPTPTVNPSASPTATPGNLGDTLVNISTRAHAETGSNVLIGGFIIGGSANKTVAVRALGPSLTGLVSTPLADPTLQLRDSSGVLIAANDNWQNTILGPLITSNQVAAIAASGLAPTEPSESAMIVTLGPGNYTAIVTGTDGVDNIALVEVYDLDPADGSQLLNISTRGLIDTGDGMMIAGLIVGGIDDEAIVVRGLGPSLPVANPLPDPTLTLVDADGNTLAQDDNWADTQGDDIEAAMLAPTNQLESAILQTLPPGQYTAILTDSTGQTGVGLIEVYNITADEFP